MYSSKTNAYQVTADTKMSSIGDEAQAEEMLHWSATSPLAVFVYLFGSAFVLFVFLKIVDMVYQWQLGRPSQPPQTTETPPRNAAQVLMAQLHRLLPVNLIHWLQYRLRFGRAGGERTTNEREEHDLESASIHFSNQLRVERIRGSPRIPTREEREERLAALEAELGLAPKGEELRRVEMPGAVYLG